MINNLRIQQRKLTITKKLEKLQKKPPREGFIAQAVREFYDDLKDVKHDAPKFTAAVKLGKRCHQNLIEREESGEIMELTCSKSKYRKEGDDRKVTIPNICEALLEWFVDVRGTLKARLPRKTFKAQYKILYDQWLAQQPSEIPDDKKIVFFNRWIKNWMKEYVVSFRHPNKRFQIKQSDKEEKVYECLKNVWTVHKFFIDNYGFHPPIINGDQMPLH